ncbi:dethiobiotin synthase, partial [Pseudomonas syringae]
MSAAYFITGTDTDAGKTTVAAGLLHAARLAGLSTAAGKPVASGCVMTAQGLRNADALALQAECSVELDYDEVNPLALEPAIAPHLAAREAGVALTVESLLQPMRHILSKQADFTLIEGAGGWRVPLAGERNLSDLAIALKLPVILVVGVRLGCINHAV